MMIDAMRTWVQQALQSRFMRDVAWLGGSTVVAQAIGVMSLPLIAFFYSPADFGQFTLFVAGLTLASLLASCGFEQTIMQSRGDRAASQIVVLIVLMSFASAAALCGLEALVSYFHPGWRPEWATGRWLVLFPIAVSTIGIASALRYWSMRRRRFSFIASAEIARALMFVGVACGIGLWVKHAEAAALCFAYTFAEMARLAVLARGCILGDAGSFARPTPKRLAAALRRNMRLSGIISLNNAMQMGAFRLPHLVLGSAFGSAALGHFAMAERVVAMPTQVISTAVGDVFRQRASARYLSDGNFSTLAERTLLTMGALSIIPFAVAILLAPWAFTVLLGPDWTASGHVAQILLIGEVFGFIVNPIAPTAIIVSANRYLFFWALSRLTLMSILAALVAMHILSLFQFLWLFVAVRVLMVSTDGAFCYRYSRANPARA